MTKYETDALYQVLRLVRVATLSLYSHFNTLIILPSTSKAFLNPFLGLPIAWAFSTPGALATTVISTSPVLWLDGSDVDGDGTPDAGTGTVATWSDRSPGGNDVTGLPGTQPVTVANYNGTGLNAVQFSADSLSRAGTLGMSGAPAITVFVVSTTTATVGDGRMLQIGDDGASNGGRNISFGADSSWRFNNGNNIFANDPINGAGPSIAIWRSAADTNYGEKEFFLNGPLAASDTDGPDTGGPTTIAGGGAGFTTIGSGWYANSAYTAINAHADGDYAEILVYDVELGSADIEAVGFYLQEKWDISGATFVPEPSAALLGAIGGMSLLLRRRRNLSLR